MKPEREHDVIGIGFGPANIAVAIAREELFPDLDIHFLEQQSGPLWQPGMLFEDADIQNHPLRDLVTPRNPRSRYSFTNFLFETGRLFEHLNLGMLFPLRIEYAQYIAWVAEHFRELVEYDCAVSRIEPVRPRNGTGGGYVVHTRDRGAYGCRSLIVAPGRTPYVPPPFRAVLGRRVVHLVDYLGALAELAVEEPALRVAVVGGSQSAVEIILHLSGNHPEARIAAITHNFGYRLKDTSPFTGEVFFPSFVDRYYRADEATKLSLRRELWFTNYSAADRDVLDALYRELYQQKIQGEQRIEVFRRSRVVAAREGSGGIELELAGDDGATSLESFDLVVLATGFCNIGLEENQQRTHPLLDGISEVIEFDPRGCIQVELDYALKLIEPMHLTSPCFVNGLCESSHGMGDAGSFSLLALRSQAILEAVTRRLGLGAGMSAKRARSDAPGGARLAAAELMPR